MGLKECLTTRGSSKTSEEDSDLVYEYFPLTEDSYLNDDLEEVIRTVQEHYAGDAKEMV